MYYVNKVGVLYCCNAETGEWVFRKRINAPCWASPIGVTSPNGESLAYFPMKDGVTLVLRPGPEFDEVARNVLWSEEQLAEAAKAARQQRQQNRPADKPVPAAGSPEAQLAQLPEQKLHEVFSYGDPVVYAMAIADGRLMLRTGPHLYCIASDQ